MNILIIGYSSIARRKIIPALIEMGVSEIDIASLSSNKKDVISAEKLNEFYGDYDLALKETKSNLVYISLVNSSHSEWALKSLSMGKHVVVDKPAFLTLKTTKSLLALAKKKRLLLAEATVFCYHDAFEKILSLSKRNKISNIMASFSFPPLDHNNYRYSRELGGGALADLGPYAATIGRFLFKSRPKKVICKIIEKDVNTGVDIAFLVMAVYSDSRSILGYFGFNSEYQNFIKCTGSDISIYLNRFISLPNNVDAKIEVTKQGVENEYLRRSDAFKNFLISIEKAIKHSHFESFYQDILDDAIFRNSMEISTIR